MLLQAAGGCAGLAHGGADSAAQGGGGAHGGLAHQICTAAIRTRRLGCRAVTPGVSHACLADWGVLQACFAREVALVLECQSWEFMAGLPVRLWALKWAAHAQLRHGKCPWTLSDIHTRRWAGCFCADCMTCCRRAGSGALASSAAKLLDTNGMVNGPATLLSSTSSDFSDMALLVFGFPLPLQYPPQHAWAIFLMCPREPSTG